ncbi:hypothetical protein [Paractinoplanes rishiriensis]|uniref:Uncharacterized protein n=1 Tax=Paractinoplanes rishiriensis TaxID=1050105 RepID=A0A919MT75_9ACTN|nr:hypothetical protein [Actinoplanes rishiriensis]GIE98976.1 hypothetical protein Ari01nite_64410 [Actinoplanes rishiriensis]
MEIYTMKRPSAPLTPACAPSALTLVPAAAPVAVPAVERALISAQAVRPVAILAAELARVSWAHQVQVQAELAQALTLTNGINGTTGFNGTSVSTKRYADGGSGVPPRGRPV